MRVLKFLYIKYIMYSRFNIVIFLIIILLLIKRFKFSNKDGFLDSYHRCINQGYSNKFCLNEPV